jgi:phosphatidate cytidylyltransferase
MPLINNPLESPLLIPVALRLAAILGGGLVVVVLFNIRDPRRTFRSGTWLRYRSWLVMAPTFLTSVFFGGLVAVAFIWLLMYLALAEYGRMLNLPHFYRRLLVVNSILSVATAVLAPQFVQLLPVAYFLIIVLASIMHNQIEGILDNACHTLFASVWLCFSLAHFLLFRTLQNGTALLVMIAFSVVLSDVFAYCLGNVLAGLGVGTDLTIANLISPNKTYAGMIGNVAGALVGALIFASLNSHLPISLIILLGICIGITSLMGDLAESMVKRFADVKDSGASIPGHGGILDRIDSLLIVIVVCFYMVRILS